jgi:hypothetical protein
LLHGRVHGRYTEGNTVPLRPCTLSIQPPGTGGCSLFPGTGENENEVQYEGKCIVESLAGCQRLTSSSMSVPSSLQMNAFLSMLQRIGLLFSAFVTDLREMCSAAFVWTAPPLAPHIHTQHTHTSVWHLVRLTKVEGDAGLGFRSLLTLTRSLLTLFRAPCEAHKGGR